MVYLSNIDELLANGTIQLSCGFAFEGIHSSDSGIEHICVIINDKVKKGGYIHFVHITSQRERVYSRLKYDIGAIVEINKKDYNELTKRSYVQCGKRFIHHIKFAEFTQKLKDGEFNYQIQNPPKKVMEKIINAIVDGKTFSTQDLKELLS